MGGSLYISAPFGSFIPQRLGFIGGSFNNKSLAFEMKSSCFFAWARDSHPLSPPVFFLFFILGW